MDVSVASLPFDCAKRSVTPPLIAFTAKPLAIGGYLNWLLDAE